MGTVKSDKKAPEDAVTGSHVVNVSTTHDFL